MNRKPPAIPADQVPHLRAAGAHLRAARIAAGLTVTQVALAVGVSDASVIRTEEGRKRTKRATFERYGAAIDPSGRLAADLVRLAGPGLSDRQKPERKGPDPAKVRAGRTIFRPDATEHEVDEAIALLTRGSPAHLAESMARSLRIGRAHHLAGVEHAGNAPAPAARTEVAGHEVVQADEVTSERYGCGT
jgi:transcriptional regulator with XRE-family HTH domain